MALSDKSLGCPADLHRRAWFTFVAALVLPTAPFAHGYLGPVEPPRSAPRLALTLHDGRQVTLPEVLRGRVTALQLMFTGCSATCPIQGAVFAALQPLVFGPLAKAQLLSLSIDPLSDHSQALAAWRTRFGAGPRWLAARPAVAHASVMPEFVGGGTASSDQHSAQVYLFDSQARFAFRCAEFASASDIARAMLALGQR